MKNNLITKSIINIRKLSYMSLQIFEPIVPNKNQILVLCYHSFLDKGWLYGVTITELEKQLDFLIKKYQPITLFDLEMYLKGRKKIESPSFVVTIDDGYKSVMRSVASFRKFNIKPALFVLSDTQKSNRKELGTQESFLSKQDILRLKKIGWEIGSHSSTHSNFNNLSSDQIKKEITESRKDIEKQFGGEIKYFAYPKGRYTQEVLTQVKKSGYKLGLSMNDGFISKKTNYLLIPRIGVNRTHSLNEFKGMITTPATLLRMGLKNIGFGRFVS